MAFEHTAKFWHSTGLPVFYGDDPDRSATRAWNNAARKALAAGHDVLCFADADVQTPRTQIEAAAKVAAAEGCAVLAFTEFVKVRRKATRLILTERPHDWEQVALETANVWREHPSCSIVVSADLYRMVGGFDERLTRSWGHDDRLFLMACDTLSGVPYRRVKGRCWHWWHPASPAREDRFEHPSWPDTSALIRRYVAAAGLAESDWPEGEWPHGDRHSGPGRDRGAMLKLLSEPGGPLA